ncbi:VanZ family protein [Thiobacter aerophilum]|uniref:VanZ family protein n=1 Tax=Thiobacter aerophilum TaxID=3121275 RepID=A0ABV0EDP8_9BURK
MSAPRPSPPLALFFYAALLVYGSLYPLYGWRVPEPAAWGFLIAPVPPVVTRTDLATNVLVYVPFGWLMARALTASRRLRVALPMTCAAAALFSTAMETGQLFIPGRIASNLDIAANSLGALLGGLLYGLARWDRLPGRLVMGLRHRLLAPGRLSEAALLLLALWALLQLSLEPPSLLAGHLNRGFLPFWEVPSHLDRLEPLLAAIYAGELVVVGLMLATVLRQPPRPMGMTVAATTFVLACKFAAAAVLLKWTVLERLLSVELISGLAAGALSLNRLLGVWPQRPARWSGVAIALLLGAALVYLIWPGMVEPSPRRLNVTGLAAAGALAWPWLSALYLAVARGEPPSPRPSR